MSRRLPPLNSLRAFDAAARSGSFVLAGRELHLTAAAISHHIRELEEALGVALFERLARGVRLTPAGAAYQERIGEALLLVEEATARLTRPAFDGPLRLTLPQSFAQAWLVPRLPGLLRRHPGLQLDLVGETRLADLRAGQADLAIRFGAGDYPGLRVVPVLGDALTVLRSARLPATADTPLLEDRGAPRQERLMHWGSWLRVLGRRRGDGATRLGFSDSAMMLAACSAGAGLCIGRLSLAFDALRRGELLPFSGWRPTEFAYHLLCRPEDADAAGVLAFAEWLRDEARAFASSVQAEFGVQLAVEA